MPKMTRCDRFLDVSWRTVTWTLIAAMGLLALTLLYSGMMSLFAQKWHACALPLALSIGLLTANIILCRYRNDVIGE